MAIKRFYIPHKKGMRRALGLKSDGGNAFTKTLSGNLIRSRMPDNLWEKIQNPLIFNVPPRDLECRSLYKLSYFLFFNKINLNNISHTFTAICFTKQLNAIIWV